eukprot:1144512-Pelagomonas_calceolata.AAC.2
MALNQDGAVLLSGLWVPSHGLLFELKLPGACFNAFSLNVLVLLCLLWEGNCLDLAPTPFLSTSFADVRGKDTVDGVHVSLRKQQTGFSLLSDCFDVAKVINFFQCLLAILP